MTPLLRHIYQRTLDGAIRTNDRDLWSYVYDCEDALCFEMTEVNDLIITTTDTLLQHVGHDEEGRPYTSHGGLMTLPHETVWIEWRLTDLRTGQSDRVGVMVTPEPERPDDLLCAGLIGLDPTRQKTFELRLRRLPDDMFRMESLGAISPEETILVQLVGMHTASSLLILNAPYGISKTAVPIHKGHAREARSLKRTLKEHHVVRIDKTKAPPSEYASTGHGSPRCFHWVRPHLRRYATKTVRVKAHWRGDPRLGVLPTPDYTVRP